MSMLIEPEMLATLVNDEGLVIVDARYSLAEPGEGLELYRQGHIPGAVYGDLGRDLSGPVIVGETGRHPLPTPEAFEQTIQHWGVNPDSNVVIYDDGGHAMAARAWWLFRWAGLKQVSILHGGMKAWLACRYPVTTEFTENTSGACKVTGNGMSVISADELLQGMSTSRYTLIDARARERFSGAVEPLDSQGGHISGALCRPFAENLDENGRFLSPECLRDAFEKMVDPQKTTVFYCGSGVTACHNMFAYQYAGLQGAVLYPGSWSEWITDPRRPTSRGNEGGASLSN